MEKIKQTRNMLTISPLINLLQPSKERQKRHKRGHKEDKRPLFELRSRQKGVQGGQTS